MNEPSGETLALDLRGVTKVFGVVRALDRVDFRVRGGSVHALLGENGAGKTSLMRVAYGMITPDQGSVRVFGRDTEGSVRGARAAGVGMVHQHRSLVPTLTAAENFALGNRGRFDPESTGRRLRDLSQATGLPVPESSFVADLTIVQQQRLEILKALGRGARLLIMDEPTALLAPRDVDDLLRWMRRFADAGGSVVLVTHKLREALGVADKVTVLRGGSVMHTGDARPGMEAELGAAIFADAPAAAPTRDVAVVGQTTTRARAISILAPTGGASIVDASFELRRGEIIGLAAVEGSGHRALLRALAHELPVLGGELMLPPSISVIPSDRQREAIIPDFSLSENVALRGAGERRGILSWRAFRDRALDLVRRFGIVTASVDAKAGSLSGGNQQRLVVARELDGVVDLVVADNPTHGLDIRATAFVHDQLRAAAAAGATVVVHSSDVDEMLVLASRVLVVFQGTITEVEPDRDRVGMAMLGAA